VSLEQMLVGLYRSNPDAFIKKNMNLVKSGKILRIPDAQELASISQGEAMKEYRAQVADWRAYSGRVADAAGQAPEGAATARGRITAKVDDPAAAEGKDVVKLSKGEPGKGDKPLTGAARDAAVAEEKVARKQELAEAKDRITQLEKTVKDGQKLAELKSPGMAAAQQQAEAAKAESAKADMTASAKPESPAPTDEARKDVSAVTTDKPAEEVKPAAKPKPKFVAPPPPPPEPSLMDMMTENLPLIGGGALAVVLGAAGVAALRRRRARAENDDEPMPVAPTMGAAAAGGAAEMSMSDTTVMAAVPASEDVDPVAEAEVYIAYGRDGQAEEILKEAMSRDPAREDVQVKLAEVYAARKDSAAFAGVADSMYGLTGGAGDNWLKVAALGYVLDPANPLYEAGRDAAPFPIADDSPTGTDLDFDLGGDTAGTPDIALDADPAGQTTEMGGMQELAAAADASVPPAEPDFNLDAGTLTDIAPVAPPAEASSIDFNFELPPVDAPAAPAVPADSVTNTGLDFKIDVGDLNINLDEPVTTAGVAEGKDGHWYDVQQKFDLAKAYQEMGDNDGAREILQEVLKEGDGDQKDQAQKLLNTLG